MFLIIINLVQVESVVFYFNCYSFLKNLIYEKKSDLNI